MPGCGNQQDDDETTKGSKSFPHPGREDLSRTGHIDYDRPNWEDDCNKALQKQPRPETRSEDRCPCSRMRFIFFKDSKKKIPDDKLFPLIEKTLDMKNPREWYYALMDYGAHLKKQLPNPSRRSAHHVRQPPFKGSNRELRAKIVREIIKRPQSAASLRKRLAGYPSSAAGAIAANLSALAKEGFIEERAGTYRIA